MRYENYGEIQATVINEATVIEIRDEKHALVRTVRKSACSECHNQNSKACTACDICFSPDTLDAVAENSVGAKKGDRVIIEASSKDVISLAALVFIVPVITAVIGYIIGYLCGAGEDISVLSAFIGFAFGVAVAFVTGKLLPKRDRIYIKEIIIGENTDESIKKMER